MDSKFKTIQNKYSLRTKTIKSITKYFGIKKKFIGETSKKPNVANVNHIHLTTSSNAYTYDRTQLVGVEK